MSGRIRLIGYVCVLRGSNIYGNKTESANRSQHASSMHSIRLCATQHYDCCWLVDIHYTSITLSRAWPSKEGSAMLTKSQKKGVDPQSGTRGSGTHQLSPAILSSWVLWMQIYPVGSYLMVYWTLYA